MVGLTGSHEQVSKVAKSYRVYYSKPPKLQPGEEYLVDHSIFFYLMNPDGEFVDVYGKNLDAEQVSTSIIRHAKDFLKKGGVITTD
jgi:protein SCO1/2